VIGLVSRWRSPSGPTATLIWSGLRSEAVPETAGRLSLMVCWRVMVRLTIMKEARRKNMMSISGMISSRVFR
jgi:hypothetical protein